MPLMHHALRMGLRSARPPRFRRACAADVARFCPNATTRRAERECLEGKHDTLEADCKTALDAPRRRREETTR